MGDVVGRGIPAASLVGKLRNGLRAYALEGHPPGEVLRRLNALVSDTRREMSTAIFVEFRPGTGELRGANAGHPRALVRRAGGRIERWDAARSMPLGVVGHARYEDEAIRLEPGDAVLLFTDGLIERRGLPIGDALDRLERAVPPSGSADELRTAVLDRTLGGEDHDDDVAVLAIAVPVDVPEEVELELPAVPGSLASMRRAIDLWMNGTDVPPEIRERAMLALGEAAGNAVEHAYGPAPASFAVAARTVGASMEIVVSDSGSWRPPRGSGRGRGLRIIEAVSDSVDVERGADGTIVRLTYALPEDER
jgi:anti-sigma regulatory factor (Ser/Thr protein kinase)